MKQLALIGNQNSGKSTLFNILTDSNQHVGNFPGVTVEKKEGRMKSFDDVVLVDLPGIYSLSPFTLEERVTCDYLLSTSICGIINVVDASSLERNLYLSLQLLNLEIPMIIVLTMMDEVIKSGSSIDYLLLSSLIGVRVIPSLKNSKMELLSLLSDMVNCRLDKPSSYFYNGNVHRCINVVSSLLEEKLPKKARVYYTIECIESFIDNSNSIPLTSKEILIMNCMLDEVDFDMELVSMRYQLIDQIYAKCVMCGDKAKHRMVSNRIDSIVLHHYWGIPIFLLIMLFIFQLAFGWFGKFLQVGMKNGIVFCSHIFLNIIKDLNVSSWILSLIENGMIAGVGSVLSFLPVIMVLFFFLSLLEDSGYMARVVFMMDKLLRKIGLSGRSFVPLLLGFGCSVPSILATRTLVNERERRLTILLIPFMSCSAKLPIYGMISMTFLPGYGGLLLFIMYIVGISVAIMCALFFKEKEKKETLFYMELPVYRIPSFKSITQTMWNHGKEFIKKTFTVILLSSVILWFLQYYTIYLTVATKNSTSLLALIGSVISPIFKPLGFNDWRIATAIIAGIIAKENVVSTLSVITNSFSDFELICALSQMFNSLSALSFLLFVILYMPCIATFDTIRNELGSWKEATKYMILQTGIAYLVAMVFYQIGSIFIN